MVKGSPHDSITDNTQKQTGLSQNGLTRKLRAEQNEKDKRGET